MTHMGETQSQGVHQKRWDQLAVVAQRDSTVAIANQLRMTNNYRPYFCVLPVAEILKDSQLSFQ